MCSSASKPVVRTTAWTEWCSWATWSDSSPRGSHAGTPGRSLCGIRSDNTSIRPLACVRVCVYLTPCVCCFLSGGFVHAHCGGGHRRPLRTVVSLLRCWHTHVVPGRQGQSLFSLTDESKKQVNDLNLHTMYAVKMSIYFVPADNL